MNNYYLLVLPDFSFNACARFITSSLEMGLAFCSAFFHTSVGFSERKGLTKVWEDMYFLDITKGSEKNIPQLYKTNLYSLSEPVLFKWRASFFKGICFVGKERISFQSISGMDLLFFESGFVVIFSDFRLIGNTYFMNN